MALIVLTRRKLALGLILTALAYGFFGAPTNSQAAGDSASTNSFSDECRTTGTRCQCGW
jgi:hypothetical protein